MVREQKCRWVFDGFFMEILQWVCTVNPSNEVMTRWFGIWDVPKLQRKIYGMSRREPRRSL